MKHIMTVVLIAIIITLCLTASAVALAEAEGKMSAGDASHGFTVKEVGRVESLGADIVKLTHNKTGARVIFVLNDDTNLGFSICFHTEPSDDTGMLHILEHAVCAASEKYPGRDVFFDAISQAYLTGLNAWTSLSSTNYYATSMDENQLEALADFYLDCAFNSALNTEPNYFYREGWRYEMPTLEDDLTINGIVYNEMRGSYGNIFNSATANLNRALFPDTYQSRDSGGNPANIPDLSYEALMAFYKSCYSPANSVTMFYGNVDVERFLKLLNDGYFCAVDPGVKAPVSAAQAPFDAPAHVVDDFPVSEDSEDTGSVIFYSSALSEEESADYTNYAICNIITELFCDNSCELMKALNASGIGSSYGAYVANVGTQLVLNFYAADADASRDEEFKEIILDKLAQMAGEGFSEDMLRSLFASEEMSLRLRRNSENVAIKIFENLTWIQEMGNDAPLDASAWYKKADEMCVPGYAEGKTLDWVVNNPHAALVTTKPVPGLLEKNAKALEEKLALKKSSMTDAEKLALADKTTAFNEWILEETPQETLKKVSVVNPATVEANWPEREITSETIGQATVSTAPSSMDMTAVKLLFDVSHLTDEELCRLKMITYIAGASTEAHSQEQITVKMARLMNSFSSDVTALKTYEGYVPVLSVLWYAPNESLAESVELAFEIIKSTDLTANADLLKQRIDAKISDYRDPETVNDSAIYAATASTDGMSGLLNKLNGLSFLEELNSAKAEYARDAAATGNKLESIREKALRSFGARVMLVGDSQGIAKEAILDNLEELPASHAPALERNDLTSVKSTAIVGSTQASYITRGVVLDDPATSVTGDKFVLGQLLRGEYLLPALRFRMGAYGASITLSSNGYWTMQYYRGGTPFEADEIILSSPEFVDNLDISQERLDAYKLPAISGLLTSGGELNDALSEMTESLFGFTREKRLALVEEIRKTTVDDIKALSGALKDMLDDSGIALITSAGEIEGRESSFDSIEKMP